MSSPVINLAALEPLYTPHEEPNFHRARSEKGQPAKVVKGRRPSVISIAHNHPSGDLKPSNSDLKIHEQLTEAGKILGIRILDHLIVTRKGYYSFQEAGLID